MQSKEVQPRYGNASIAERLASLTAEAIGGWILILLVISGVVLSGVLYHFLNGREEAAIAAGLQRRADRQRTVVAARLQEYRDSLLVLEGLFRFSHEVERLEFRGAAAQLLQRYPGVHAFQWAPRVPAEERGELERRGQEAVAADFQIREKGGVRGLVSAGERAVYFPIYYTQPREGNEVMFGYDLASSTSADVITQAAATGEIIGTTPFPLIQDASQQLGWILICPVYHPETDLTSPESRMAGLRGVLQGVFQLPSLFEDLWKTLDEIGIETILFDVTPGSPRQILFQTAPEPWRNGQPVTEAEIRAGMHLEHTIDIAGRQWLLLSRPSPSRVAERRPLYPELACLAGLIITTLLGGYLQLIRSRERAIRQLVAQRTSELESSRNSLQLALQSARMGTWDWDTRADRLQISVGLEALLGIPEGSFADGYEGWMKFVLDEDAPRLRAEVDAMLATGAPFKTQFRIRRGDGDVRWLASVARSFVEGIDPRPVRIIGVTRDITEQKQAEEEIQRTLESEREARLRAENSEQVAEEAGALLDTVFQTAPVGLAFLDAEMRFVRVNEMLAAISGAPVEAHLGRTVHEVNSVVSIRMAQRHRQVMKTGQPVVNIMYEGPRVTESGLEQGTWIASYYPIRKSHGAVYGVGAVLVDITDLRKAEGRMQTLAAVVEQSGDVMLILSPSGKTEYANGVFCRQSGIPVDQIIGMDVGELTKAVGVENRFADVIERVADEGSWGDRIQMLSAEGDLLAIDFRVTPLRNENGAITNLVVVGRDVTRELGLEERLRTSQKMEAVGLLAGGIAHDFNNLLQVIEGYTALCLDLPCSPDELTQNLQQVREAAGRAAQLTRQLLLFSRRQPLARSEVDLHELTANILKMIRRLIGPQIEVTLEDSASLSAVQADRGQLEQVLLNLCVNARDAMPNGGRITIHVREMDLDSATARQFPDLKMGRYVRLTISDTGTGIPADVRTRIFEPFFTTKPSGHGTGLGLSVVYGIVRQHDGAILVDSGEGQGTTFSIYLPAIPKRAQAKIEAPPRRLARGSETILLVEDEDPVRQLTSIVLRQAGYRVIEAKDGQEACDIFSPRMHEIDLVLMDVMMPRMGGLEAWRRIRAMRQVPVLFCSGYTGSPGDLPAGVPLLAKPFTSDKLLAAIRDVLERQPVNSGTAAAAK